MKAEPLVNKIKWISQLINKDYVRNRQKDIFLKKDITSVHQWLKQHIRCPSSLWNSEKKYRKEMLKKGFVVRLGKGEHKDLCFVHILKLNEYRQWLLNIAFTDVIKK